MKFRIGNEEKKFRIRSEDTSLVSFNVYKNLSEIKFLHINSYGFFHLKDLNIQKNENQRNHKNV